MCHMQVVFFLILYRARGIPWIFQDFNSRHVSWNDSCINDYGAKLFDYITQSDYSLISPVDISFKSWNGTSVIDLIIVSSNVSNCVKSTIADKDIELFTGVPGAGHYPVVSNICFKNYNLYFNKSEIIDVYDYKNEDWESWLNFMENSIDINFIDSLETPQQTKIST